MDITETCVDKAAAVEGAAKYFPAVELAMVEFAKFKIRLLHRAIDELAVPEN